MNKVIEESIELLPSDGSKFLVLACKPLVLAMIFSVRPRDVRHLTNFHQNAIWIRTAFRSFCQSHLLQEAKIEIDKITRIINDHPFPDTPIYPTLLCHIPSHTLSSAFVENVLGSLFAAHTNGLKAYEFYKFSLQFSHVHPTSDAFEKTVHILTRMRYFDTAWELMEEIAKRNPSLLTLKAMSIMLSRIAKFQTYEATLKAFEKMEKHIFVGRKFGTNEFNVLLRAFCTQRQMKEAKSIFKKMHARFPPNSRTMNILLLGFKETSNLAAVELFYHEMVRRRFKPNAVTYNIRIDAYCKKGSFGDGLRLFQEMECVNCLPTLETITTLIHGAGLARNTTRAWQLFNEISARNLCPDIAAYNALISSLVKCGEVQSAILLMDEMEDEHIGHDGMTYHTLFYGLMRSGGIEGVCDLFDRMTNKHFVPKTQTVVMLMKFFCQSRRLDLGLNLWEYVVGRGFCPHDHTLALLVTGLCSHGRTEEAFECSKQMLSRGRNVSSAVFRMLERFLLQAGEEEKLRVLDDMTKRLQRVNPPSPH